MLGRQERVALLLLVGVAVTVVTAYTVLSMIGKHPFAHPFTGNSTDGELVIVEGTVERATIIENGGHLALQVNNISVFIPATASQNLIVHKGDTILAYGIVQTYRGKKEIVISSAEDIHITTIP
jgi:DNA/RNA endonuclease YhcR with UshA esterase domain